MDKCVFCQIVTGEMTVEKIMEDDNHIAFLGANPVYDGFTVIIPKKHYGSYVFQTMSDEDLASLHLFAKKVAKKLDKALGSERCVQVMEGLGVDHAHVKLFPKYPGVTHVIVEKDIFDLSRLKEVAQKIRKAV